MRAIKDKNGNVLEEGHVIIYPSFGRLMKGQILKICDNTFKISIERFKSINGYAWIENGWNINNHNSFQYKYLHDFIIIGKNEITDISKLKKKI